MIVSAFFKPNLTLIFVFLQQFIKMSFLIRQILVNLDRLSLCILEKMELSQLYS